MKKSTLLLVAIFCIAFNLNSISQVISGTVFRDFNGNGAKDNTASFNEPFVAGITVKAFNAAGVQVGGTQTTSAVGAYSITTGAGSFRIEFTGLGTGDYSSTNGTANGTNVQFVTAPSATTNYGINNPVAFAQSNPNLATAVFTAGDPTAVGFPTNGVSNTAIASSLYDFTGVIGAKATLQSIGSVWGLAYEKKTQKLFSAAFLKRLCGFGPLGIGGIYATNVTTNTSSTLIDLSLTYTFGAAAIPTNTARGLTSNPTAQIVDSYGWNNLGKEGLGDLEISDDGNSLFTVNLYSKRVIKIDITNYVLNGTLPLGAQTSLLPAYPATVCTNGTDRPFGLGYHKGELYLGVVCDANTGTSANLTATIYKFNFTSNTWSTAITFSLNYQKGYTHNTAASNWNKWTENETNLITTQGAAFEGRAWPQPILSDIEFDINEEMIIGFADKGAHMLGAGNRTPASATQIHGVNGGDILRAGWNGSNYVIESAGTTINGGGSGIISPVPPNNSTAPGLPQGQGLGNGEFYAGEYFNNHAETSMGGLAVLAGAGQVAISAIDPAQFESGGIIKLNNSTGLKDAGREFYASFGNPGTFGKSAGMGDLEFLSDFAPIQIGNRIWQDTNGNGVQDAGETSTVADGTTVTLRSPGVDGIYGNGDDQTWITTTTTGNYYFSALSSADNRKPATWTGVGNTLLPSYGYRIEVATPTGFQVTKVDAAANSVDNIDNDAVANSTNAYVTFNTSNTNHNFDIGFKPLASLGDKVWLDNGVGGGTTNNGTQDGTEPGVAGVTVTLYASNGTTVLGTTITDAYGNYLFDNLAAATYVVGFTLPANYQFTTQTNTADDANTTGIGATVTSVNGSDANATTGKTYGVVLSAGENNRNVDAGLIFNTPVQLNSLGDKVWFDNGAGANANNGVQNTDEPGVAGVSVTLYASNGTTVIATTVTDANGNYIFTNLPATTDYVVGFAAPAGTVFTTTSGTTTGNATNNSDVNATLGNAAYGKTAIVNTGAAGNQITGIDAGIIIQAANTASLGDRVWNDLNSNGTQDAGEPGIANITVNLYEDANGDGVLTGGELVAVRTTTTDAFGIYNFSNLVVTGTNKWQVEFVQPSGYNNTPVADNNSGNDATDSDISNNATDRTDFIRLKFNQRNTRTDAGFVSTAPGILKLGDKVFRDDNSNGQQDATEPGVPGVTVKLYQNGTDGLPGTLDDVLLASTSTDINGNYLFTNLSATTNAATNYNVQFSNIPAGFSFTTTDAGADATDNDANGLGKTGSYNLTADNLTVDAGIKQGTASGKGSLGNKVWIDLTGGTTNVQDANEPGVAGVTVKLYKDANGDGVLNGGELTEVASTITNAIGEYIFDNLDAGNYQVGFSTLPASYTLVTKDAGTDDNLDSDGNPLNTAVAGNTAAAGTSYTGLIALAQGEDNLSVDLGLTPPANTNTVGNYVWFDANNDGLQAGEQGVPGVAVTLYNNVGTAIATTTTDVNGLYLFTGLADGDYSVGFSNLPSGYDFTTVSAINDLTGSDADRISGRTPTVTLNYVAGGTSRDNRSLDGGLVSTRAALGNKVWDDLNGDGIQDANEPGVAGVTVILYAADGTTVLSSTITDQNGNYLFANLNAGTYIVEFTTLPNGKEFTQQNTPGDNQNNTNSDASVTTGKTAQIVLSAGEVDLTIDAGIRSKPVATVGNRVWDDFDGNGLQDAGEPGIPGVIATLYDNATGLAISSAVTDGNGNWLITNVPTGNYYVIFSSKPAGNFTVPDNGGAGTGGGTDSDTDSDADATGKTGVFAVTPNTINLKIDAGITQTLVLPISRLQATATLIGTIATINWKTENEINTTRFYVERSTDNQTFTSIGDVAAAGNNAGIKNYSLLNDVTALSSTTIYYRVRLEDVNGKITYSNTVTVRMSSITGIKTWPNPFKNSISISLYSNINTSLNVRITDVAGKTVAQYQYKIVKGNNQVIVTDIPTMAKGIYMLEVKDKNNNINTVKKINKD